MLIRNADEHDSPPDPGGRHGSPEAVRRIGRFDDERAALATRPFTELVNGLAHARGAESAGKLAASRQRLDRKDLAGAGGLENLNNQKSDRAAAEHCHPLEKPGLGETDSVDRDAKRLEHGRVIDAEGLG